jgi:hypothetical protein
LAESHIADVAIVVLLISSLNSGVRGIGLVLFPVLDFLVTAVAIRGIPSGSGTFSSGFLLSQMSTFNRFLNAFIALSAASALSQWIHKLWPFQVLSECRDRLGGNNHV